MRLFCIALILIAGATAIYPQTPTRPRADRNQDNIERRMSNLSILEKIARDEAARAKREEARIRSYRPELTEDLAKTLEADNKHRTQYESLLAGDGTGIVKLLGFEDCEKKRDSSRLGKCLQYNINVREFGNSFSFREAERNVFARSDLAVYDKYLVGGMHSVQTLIVNLGSIPLESINLDTPGIVYLEGYDPGDTDKKIDIESDTLRNGITVVSYKNWQVSPRFNYSKLARIADESTYAIRSIAYRPAGAEALPKDQDVIVVFKVVDVDKNGAVTIVWKELKRSGGKVMLNEIAEPEVD